MSTPAVDIFERWPLLGAGLLKPRILVGALLILVMVWSFANESRAHNPVSMETLSFDISPQPLENALEAYTEQSRLEVLYETALTGGRRSNGVVGRFTREEALRQLLAKTGLELNYTGDNAFTIVAARMAISPTPAIASYNQFLGGVQVDILSALCEAAETRPGAFRLAVQFSISQAGQIENPRLLGSTGLDYRDAAIVGRLRRLAFATSPPSKMPQPITIVVWPGPEDARDECSVSRP